MSKQNIPLDRRYAVWLGHGERCWFCREPLPFTAAHIDHIIPENLAGSDKLKGFLEELGLPDDFDIFSDANFAPAHSHCNLYKSGEKFAATPLMQQVLHKNCESTSKRVGEIRAALSSDKKQARSAAIIIAALLEGSLKEEIATELKEAFADFLVFSGERRDEEQREEPLRLTPWLEVLVEDQFKCSGSDVI